MTLASAANDLEVRDCIISELRSQLRAARDKQPETGLRVGNLGLAPGIAAVLVAPDDCNALSLALQVKELQVWSGIRVVSPMG